MNDYMSTLGENVLGLFYMRTRVSIATALVLLGLGCSIHGRCADPTRSDLAVALQYVDFGSAGTPGRISSDASGNIVVVGTFSNETPAREQVLPTHVLIAKFDSSGRLLFRFVFGGSGHDEPYAAATDAQGNIYVTGWTTSDDFPWVNPLMPKRPGFTGFVTKVDSSGSRLLFSTPFGGNISFAGIYALAVDAQFNVYITGYTNPGDFPVTPGAFQINPAQPSKNSAAFVAKLSSAGDRLVYSTLLGGVGSVTSAGAISVNGAGEVTVAGSTEDGFPTTSSAFQTQCMCNIGPTSFPGQHLTTGFVTRLNSTGTALLWSTYLGGSGNVLGGLVYGSGGVSHLALDGAGNVFLVGFTASNDFPTTQGVLEPTVAPKYVLYTERGFAAKLNASGTGLLYSTYLAGNGVETTTGIAADSQGHAWVTGTTTSPDFPSAPGGLSLGNAFLVELDTDASRLLRSYRVPAGSAGGGLSLISPTSVATIGSSSALLQWSFDGSSAPSVVGVANAAATIASGRVAPGEIVSIYGTGLGPTPGVGTQLDQNGKVSTVLGGVRVLFDDKPAPLLYVSDTQINAVVPFGVAGQSSTTLQVVTPTGPLAPLALKVLIVDPNLFRNADGTVAALNEDLTVNGPQNPAKPGSIIVLYVTGAGLLDPLPADGAVTATVLSRPLPPVSVTYDSNPTELLYAGTAPGAVAGVIQVNVRLPQDALAQPTVANNRLQLQIGNTVSEIGSIYMTPR